MLQRCVLPCPDDGSTKLLRNVGAVSMRLHGATSQKTVIFTLEKFIYSVSALSNLFIFIR
jgi:hypothetical protein